MNSIGTSQLTFRIRDILGNTVKSLRIDTEDFVAIGILLLAMGAVIVASITALGLVFGRVNGGDATKIIIGCVGGSAIGGIASALLRKTSNQKRLRTNTSVKKKKTA